MDVIAGQDYALDMFHPLARLLLESVEATLIDQRFLKLMVSNDVTYQRWEYLLEVPAADGNRVRLTTQEYSFRLPLAVKNGDKLPVLVNKKRTKAAIDRKTIATRQKDTAKARDAVRKATDEARFQAKLEGRSEREAEQRARAAEDAALRATSGSPRPLDAEIRAQRQREDQQREDERFLREHGQG